MYAEAKDVRKPIGILMIEHRLIERGLNVLANMVEIHAEPPDVVSMAEMIDFFGTYADGTHHGKEEDILFIEADGMTLSAELMTLLEELRGEHVKFRGYRRRMDVANRKIAGGDHKAMSELVDATREFIPLLRQHVKKEDKIFFKGFDALQSAKDRDKMKEGFQTFDAERIHVAYKSIVDKNE